TCAIQQTARIVFVFSSRRRHTSSKRDWSSDVCSSDLKLYDTSQIYKVMYYAANSKVVFSNYNFKINNMLPSVILNLTDNLDLIGPTSDEEAFDIMNENRNTILFDYTILNLLERVYKTRLNQKFIQPYNVDNVLPQYENSVYLNNDNNLKTDLYGTMNNSRYDLENTLAFPILFL